MGFFIDKQGRVRKTGISKTPTTREERIKLARVRDDVTEQLGFDPLPPLPDTNEAVDRAKRAGVSKRELFERDVFDRKLDSLSQEDRKVVISGIESGRIEIGDIVEGATKKRISSAKAFDDVLENLQAQGELESTPDAKRQFLKENALRRVGSN